MLRLHFTTEDLANVQLAVLGPLAETQLALGNLQRRDRPVVFGSWRSRSAASINSDGRDVARFLAAPRAGPGGQGQVDLFTLTGPAATIDEGLDRLRGVPCRDVREEFTVHPGLNRRRVPWLGQSLSGARGSCNRLADTLAHCHDVLLAPYWDRIHDHLHSEQALRTRLMAQGGVAGLFDGLRPLLSWKPPVLEIPSYQPLLSRSDFPVAGRHVILAPSVQCGPVPQLFVRPDRPSLLLIYPALDDPADACRLWEPPIRHSSPNAGIPGPLKALLGRTRATVLCVIADHPACTTTQLARHAHISPASASEHATTLRHAGLTALNRHGKSAIHSLTLAGQTLLTSTAP
ncbi:hypothetical protein ADK52_38650 [Streptomyces sp. WM6372]|uniref:ArsR/SmtB family transcription factor n=1 Tax=Streptomyces sp. WM6372 TaxID=1415555 RepID=UPI0006AEC51E|nr:helix-turn-helix transcriptional regulator [Streptomyces sp. WM6372]KOU13494.1 hypothetical protein ADK52_38650 [Streptomyces sp. WM6372]